MKTRSLLCVSILALAVLIVGAPAKAQDSKVSVFGGYSFGTNNFTNQFDPGLHGYALGAAYNFNKHIGLEASFSGHNGTSTLFYRAATSSTYGEKDSAGQDIYTYVFGPKLSLPVGNFSLFTHILVGGSHAHEGGGDVCLPVAGATSCGFNSSYFKGGASGMAVKTGGGVDWNHGHWGIRILELDYIHSQLYGTESQNCNGCTTQPFSSDTSWSGVELSTGVTFNFGGMK